MKRVSDKKRAELRVERELTARLFVKQASLCADCHGALGWGSAKHEIKHRSQGGDPTDESNCILLCLPCHGARHHLTLIMGDREGTDLKGKRIYLKAILP